MSLFASKIPFKTNGYAYLGDVGSVGKRVEMCAGDWYAMVEREDDGKIKAFVLYERALFEHVMHEADVKRELKFVKKLVPIEPEIAKRLNQLLTDEHWLDVWDSERICGESERMRLKSGIVYISADDSPTGDYFEEVISKSLVDGEPRMDRVGDDVFAGLFSRDVDVTYMRDMLFDEVRAIKIERA